MSERAPVPETPYSCSEPEHPTSHAQNHLNFVDYTHNSIDKGKLFKCGNCTYSTARKDHYIRHVGVHASDKPFQCDYCDYCTTNKSHLNRHIKRIHFTYGEKPFKCEVCDYSAGLKYDLNRHVKRVHYIYRDKHFKCELCEYSAGFNCDLNRHMKTVHFKGETYECGSCDYSTSYKDHLTRHIMRIHIKDKMFRCESCEFAASAKGDLNRHVKRVHSVGKPYKCELCDYFGKDKSYVRKHMKNKHMSNKQADLKTQGKDKLFQCEYCGYCCVSERDLSAHLMISHAREEPRATSDKFPQLFTGYLQNRNPTSTLFLGNQCTSALGLPPLPNESVPPTPSDVLLRLSWSAGPVKQGSGPTSSEAWSRQVPH